MKPVVSVVIEVYNEEHNALAFHFETLDALLAQDFPLEQVELVLIGNAPQAAELKKRHPGCERFGWITVVEADPEHGHYWELKNQATRAAQAEILASADSDVVPAAGWLRAIVNAIQSGADVAVGPSLLRSKRLGPGSAWMLAATLPTWGFALARGCRREPLRAASLLSHNVGARRSLLLQHPYRAAHRSFNSSLLYSELARAGAHFVYLPEQIVAHGLTWRWWTRMHFRRGWETYAGRAADPSWPRIRLIEKMKPVEPVILRMGLVCGDALHWFRFSRVLGLGPRRTLLLFPVILLGSFIARAAEMIGMYAALLAPEATQRQARF